MRLFNSSWTILLALLILTETVGIGVYKSYCPISKTSRVEYFYNTCSSKDGKQCCEVTSEWIANYPEGISDIIKVEAPSPIILIEGFEIVWEIPTFLQKVLFKADNDTRPPPLISSRSRMVQIQKFTI